jgi:hypothetical protein
MSPDKRTVADVKKGRNIIRSTGGNQRKIR